MQHTPATPAFAMPIYRPIYFGAVGSLQYFADVRRAQSESSSATCHVAEARSAPGDLSAPQHSPGVCAVQLCVPANAEGEGT